MSQTTTSHASPSGRPRAPWWRTVPGVILIGLVVVALAMGGYVAMRLVKGSGLPSGPRSSVAELQQIISPTCLGGWQTQGETAYCTLPTVAIGVTDDHDKLRDGLKAAVKNPEVRVWAGENFIVTVAKDQPGPSDRLKAFGAKEQH